MRPQRIPALVGAALALCAMLLSALPAWAANKAIVVYVEGTESSAARERVLETVPKTLDVVDPAKFEKALADAGQKGPMGIVLFLPGKRDKTIKTIRKAIESVGAEAAIIARTRKGKGFVPELYVLYVDKIPGDLAVDEAVSMKGDAKAQTAAIKAVVAPPLEQIGPAETKPEEKPDEKPDEDKPKEDDKGKDEAEPEDDKPGDRKANDYGQAIFVLGIGFELGGRSFEYTDPITQNLRPYDVFGVPMLAVEGEIYPGATSGVTVLKDIGIVGSYQHGFGLSSQTEANETEPQRKFGTKYNRFAAGLRYRLRAGDVAVIGLSAKFGFLNFTFEPEDTVSGEITGEVGSVSYTFLRPGIDGRIPIGPVAILAGFGYLGVLGKDDVYTRFTADQDGNSPAAEASIGAIDMNIGVGIRLAAGLEARLLAEYTRFFYAFTPQVGDQYVAGGALDQFLGIRLGAAYAY